MRILTTQSPQLHSQLNPLQQLPNTSHKPQPRCQLNNINSTSNTNKIPHKDQAHRICNRQHPRTHCCLSPQRINPQNHPCSNHLNTLSIKVKELR